MRKNLLMVSLAACCAIVLSSSVALAHDNWVGTWKMNLAKSRYSPGPPPKSLTVKWEKTADGMRLTSDGMSAEGEATHGTYLSKFDGRGVPWEGNPDADTASAKKIDDNHFTNVWKMGGKATITSKAVVSNHGKTLTTVQTGRDAKGRAVKNTVVYDKQ